MKKLVIQTQYRENYGAHAWNGVGACPQYWKNKGGDTYVVNVSLAQAQDPAFYTAVDACIEHCSNYSEEYVINHELVDDVDFDINDFVESWEACYVIRAAYVDGALACAQDVIHCDTDEVVGQRTWLQDAAGNREITLREFDQAS